MSLSNVISLFGGIALFLFGMTIMANGLEKMSGGRLESVLERLTSNVFRGVLLGAVVTGLIQSSSATTVMCVGFVNAGILKLGQTVGIIMGANIGTTVTAQILRLGDISSNNPLMAVLKPASLGSVLAMIGIVLYLFIPAGRKKSIGQIFLGFGVLFIGMTIMEAAVSPLVGIPEFQQLLLRFSNPLLGVAVGAIFTALIQSSSASIGILQALSSTGLITFSTALPIILGQNIGTCITALLSSIGASKNAKRTAVLHLSFNLIGTMFFLVVVYSVQNFIGIPFWGEVMFRGSIANIHTVFNIGCTVLLLPFNKLLVRLVEVAIPGENDEMQFTGLDDRFLNSPSLAIEKARNVVVQMGKFAHSNFHLSMELLNEHDQKKLDRLHETENLIDKMEVSLDNYLVKLTCRELTGDENIKVSELMHTLSDFERIGDYADNISESATALHNKNISFSVTAQAELKELTSAVNEILDKTIICYENRDRALALTVEPLEQVIDLMKGLLKAKHIERLKTGECTIELGTQFLEVLINLERISDHCSNVAVYMIRQAAPPNDLSRFDSHEYLRQMHKGTSEEYAMLYEQYRTQYFDAIEPLK